MQNLLREITSRKGDAVTGFIDESLKALEQQTQEGNRKKQELLDALAELSGASPASLSPEMQGLQRSVIGALSQVGKGSIGNPPQELVAEWKTCHDRVIRDALRSNPPIRAMQQELDVVLERNGQSGKFQFASNKFNLPALLNACAKHLGRPQPFTLVGTFTPNVKELTVHLVGLRRRKPELHTQVMAISIRASLHRAAPHPAGCTCVLCAHMASLMPSAAPGAVPSSSAFGTSNTTP